MTTSSSVTPVNPAPTAQPANPRIATIESITIQTSGITNGVLGCEIGISQEITPEAAINLPSRTLLCTSIPHVPNANSFSECVFYVYTLHGFPELNTEAPSNVSICVATDKGVIHGTGLKVTQEVPKDGLILEERPMMVLPYPTSIDIRDIPIHYEQLYDLDGDVIITVENQLPQGPPDNRISEFVLEGFIDLVYGRLIVGNKEKFARFFRKLEGSKADSVTEIWRTNAINLPKLQNIPFIGAEYEGVGELVSRINHGCVPNCELKFNPGTFTFQVHATRLLNPGEELFRSYFDLSHCTTSYDRQLALDDLCGFVCNCSDCQPYGSIFPAA